ncbi:MAG: FAD-dependent oxidoreductase [Desulfomonile tiedjei]|uniref:FAD-dependent oxidoreductase n=1 Tax=Desulfomonile tiedjei TaxID=2358 RepID=A0A9D6V4J5_9BACT|nr:FAD-dependent oxidoreductase [Desulfomonile tiedjei]
MRFVIIGGDAAGMSAASRAKRNKPETEVIVLEQTADVSYSACGMPYNIADPARDMNDLVVRTAAVFRDKQGIDLRLGHRVERIDRTTKKVMGLSGDGKPFEVSYDKLLIATGARARLLPIPGMDLPGVVALKSLGDGRSIKSFIEGTKVKTAVVIGAGYIGLEMVEAFHERGIQVDVCDIMPDFLPWAPKEFDKVLRDELKNKGVKFRMGTGVNSVEQVNGRLRINFSDEPLDVDFALVGVGVVPNSELAADAGLELGPSNSIAVDKYLRTSDPDIYAAGDCADAFHHVTGQRVWIPLALRANRGGWAVADNLTGKPSEIPDIVGTGVFKVLDLEVARTGLSLKEARDAGFDPVENYIQSRSRAHGHPGNQTIHVHLVADLKTGRLLGAGMIGKEGAAHRIDAAAVALHASMTVAEFFGCDLAYAPPFSPVWDPLLTAANQLLKKL